MKPTERITEVGSGDFATPTARRKAISAARSAEWVKVDHSMQFERAGISVEIADIVQRDEGVDVFARAWKGRDQVGFGLDGSVDLERFHFGNPPLLVPDPSGDELRQILNPFTKQMRDFRYRVDPAEALQLHLVQTIRDVGKVGSQIEKGKRGRTTYTLFASANGTVSSTSATYSNARAGTGDALLSASSSFPLVGQALTPDKLCQESFVAWLTSSVTGVISAATASLYFSGDATTTDFTVNMRLRDWGGGTVTTADYVAGASISGNTLLATYATSGIPSNAYGAFTSEAAFISNINQSGETRVMISSSRHEGGNTPTGDEYFAFDAIADSGGTTTDPKLVVEASSGLAPVFTGPFRGTAFRGPFG